MANFTHPCSKKSYLEINLRYVTTGYGKGIKICSYFHKPGYIIDVHFKNNNLPPYLKRTNMTQTSLVEELKAPTNFVTPDSSNHSTDSVGFLDEQHKAFIALIQ